MYVYSAHGAPLCSYLHVVSHSIVLLGCYYCDWMLAGLAPSGPGLGQRLSECTHFLPTPLTYCTQSLHRSLSKDALIF